MLRCVWGFDHVLKNVQESWLANSGYSLYRKYATANKGLIINDDGAITAPPGVSTGNNTQVYIDCTPVSVSGITSLVFGFRLKTLALGNTGPLFYLAGDSAGASYVQVLTFAQLTKANVGDEVYIEVVADLVAATFTVFMDGVLIVSPTAIGATLNGQLKAGLVWMAVNLTNSGQSGLISLRDMYFLDNVGGDGFVGRQGPRRVQKVDFDLATGTGWTTTDGSDLLTTLKVAPDTANPAFGVAPSTKAPLALSMKSTFSDSFIVDALYVQLAGKVDAAGAITKTQVKDGANSTTAASLKSDFTTTLKYGVPAGVFARHPSGVRWNSANLDTASFVVLPDQVS